MDYFYFFIKSFKKVMIVSMEFSELASLCHAPKKIIPGASRSLECCNYETGRCQMLARDCSEKKVMLVLKPLYVASADWLFRLVIDHHGNMFDQEVLIRNV